MLGWLAVRRCGVLAAVVVGDVGGVVVGDMLRARSDAVFSVVDIMLREGAAGVDPRFGAAFWTAQP